MRRALRALDWMVGRRLASATHAELARVTNGQLHASRERTTKLLNNLASEPSQHVDLGETEWHEPIRVHLIDLVAAHAFITGGTGSGKTMAALLVIQALLESDPPHAFGVLDAKGELFERTLYLLARRLHVLPAADAARLRE